LYEIHYLSYPDTWDYTHAQMMGDCLAFSISSAVYILPIP
jgi:hypothetical protein